MSPEIPQESKLFKQFDYLHRVDSTNDYLKAFVEDGETRMVVAREQVSGKGRGDRSWYSPPEEGLYLSYLLYPPWRVERSPFLNMLSGLAAVLAIREEGPPGLQLKLKRPNDILIAGKKVGGILIEMSSMQDRILWAIVGIGVNLYQKDFPGDLSHATSLAQEGVAVSHPLDFCDCLTKQFEGLYRQLEEGKWESIQTEFERQL
jgi:BirA family biotin operon repressor/biotin-[acetyl-CoA-carboxylase] ligase